MIKGANSTVMVREGTISALNLLCVKTHLSKVDLISYLVSYLSTLDDKDIDDILQEGKIVTLLNELSKQWRYGKDIDNALLDIRNKIRKGSE